MIPEGLPPITAAEVDMVHQSLESRAGSLSLTDLLAEVALATRMCHEIDELVAIGWTEDDANVAVVNRYLAKTGQPLATREDVQKGLAP